MRSTFHIAMAVIVLHAIGCTSGSSTPGANGHTRPDGAKLVASGAGTARTGQVAALLGDGRVLLAGGTGTPSAQLFDANRDAAHQFSAAAAPRVARVHATATVLQDGRVLVVGGDPGAGPETAELYDPVADTWTFTGAMASTSARSLHTAARLGTGQVVVLGGSDGSAALDTVELYTPSARPGVGAWSTLTRLGTARERHTATLLGNGRVLVAGGENGSGTVQAELYDPTAGGSTAAVAMTARSRHAAALLPSGHVLVFGGTDGTTELGSYVIFDGAAFGPPQDPVTALTPRVDATATVLPDGRVLVAGGTRGGAAVTDTDVFSVNGSDVATVDSTGFLALARGGHAATVLPTGRVLLTGGGVARAELVDRARDAWTALSPAGYLPRSGHTATLLTAGAHAGQVLTVAGGVPGRLAYDRTCQYYDPATNTVSSAPDLASARAFHTATVLNDPTGSVLVTGGNAGTARNDAELFNGTSWTTLPGRMNAARSNHTATLLPSGKVLLTGGLDVDDAPQATAETYDPVTRTFTPTAGNMSSARAYHRATLLPGGRVLVAGGAGDAGADVYDPGTDSFTPVGSLTSARGRFTLTPLADGRVLAAGGASGSTALGSADVFDGAGAFAAILGAAPSPRRDHAAALLPGGEVIVAGGRNASGLRTAGAERYEPASEAFVTALVSPLGEARDLHTATPLPGGTVLVWGGENGGLGAFPERYDPFSLSAAPTRPDLTGAIASGVPGGAIGLSTSGFFTGGVGIDTRSADVNQPIFVITRQDGDGVLYARTLSFTATTARVELPAAAQPGWWWIRAIVGGVPGKALPFRMLDPFRVSPAAPTLPPRGATIFTAAGGNPSSYAWALTLRGSNDPADAPTLPTIGATTGEYQAGANAGVDTVQCTDGDGNTTTTDVTVGPRITVAPAAPWATPPRGTLTFSATGGCDPAGSYPSLLTPCTGYTWSFVNNRSGATLSPSGAYAAGPTGGVADDLQVVDNLGNHAEVTVTVTTPIVIAPTTAGVTPLGTQAFTVTGGYAAGGYTWTVSTNASGGAVVGTGAASADYTAGRTGSVTDVVRVSDALGSYAEAVVTVSAGVSITPAAPTRPPRGAVAFAATGGNATFTGCAGPTGCWSLVTNRSGGTIDAAGNYTAGATPNVTDVVQVQDTLGNLATTTVAVGPGIIISPLDPGAYPGQTVTLTATGGSGTGFTWQITTVPAHGGIAPGATDGTAVYTAGAERGVLDVVVVTDDLGNTATTDVAVWPDWKPAGSGCSSAGGGGGALGLLLVALWLALRCLPRRGSARARGARRAGAAVALLLAAGGAQAQVPPVSASFVAERFQPAGGAYDVLGVQSAQTAGRLQQTFRLYLNYASRPLVLGAPGMKKVALLRSQLGADLTGSIGLTDWAEVSLAIPFMISQRREQDRYLPPELRQSVATSGLEDVRLTPKVRLVEWGKLRLGASAPVGLPIGNKKAFLGHGAITFAPTALLELDALGPARLLLNAGGIFRPERRLVDLTIGNAYTFGAGFEYPFPVGDSRLTALATFAGESGMKTSSASRPMELLAGARWNSPSGLEVGVGGGPGVGKGYGTPQYRVFLEIGWTTAPLERLAEKPREAKPEEPKPEEPKAEEPAAKPEPPKAEEPKPEPAKPEEPKAEPPKPEEPTAEEPAPRAEADVTLRIDAHVYFDFNRKDLKEEYKPLLRRLARRILAEPRMRVIRIEGHADDLGPPDYNLWLSEERARTVKEFLERSGVPKSRFAVIGFGKTKPTKPGRTPDARARNRRVEFSVQEY